MGATNTKDEDVTMATPGTGDGDRGSVPSGVFRARASSAVGDDLVIDSGRDLGPVGDGSAVPVVFRWDHGGNEVFITGSFVGWKKKIAMHRSGNDFTYITNIPRDGRKHSYKFIVDGEWRCAGEQPSKADIDGNLNNYVDLLDYRTLTEADELLEASARRTGSTDAQMYGKFIPDVEDYAKDPPILPSQLKNIILNNPKTSKKVETRVDSAKLNTPLHVSLNHLFCSVIKDGMMVQGVTIRYKRKMVTTVYISLER